MLGVGLRADNPLSEKHIITETRSRANLPILGEAVAVSHIRRDLMTHGGQSRQDALGPTRPLVHPKINLKIGNWNVRTLYRSGNIAQAVRELTSRNIDIMGISETHWTGQGKVQLAEGETIIYSGRDDDIHREGVGILMSKSAASALMDWTPISERIIQARYYSHHIKLTIVHIYAPTEDAEEQVKDEFYTRLQDVLDGRNAHDMLIVTGDMNAKVGVDHQVYDRVMGRHGLGQRNDNGERLCELCDLNELVITGTLFPHKNIHKATWVSPDGRTKNQIDHVLINKRFRNSVKDTRVYRSADIGSDHYLVCTTVKLRLRRMPMVKKCTRTKYDTAKLKNEDILKTFSITLRNRYQVLEDEAPVVCGDDEVERDFQVMEKAFTEVANEILGKPRKMKKPWISEESWSLVDQRGVFKKKILGTHSERVKRQIQVQYVAKDREVKRSIKADKKKWMENIASEAEEAARSQHMKTLYRLTKTLCNGRPRQSTAVLDKNGNLISGKAEVQSRWTEHFKEVLNREEPANPITHDDEGEYNEMIDEIAITEPTLGEVTAAIKRLQNGNVPGIDSITAELLKADIVFSAKKIHQLMTKIWQHERIPNSWMRGLIIKIAKKGNLKDCKNWRGITLLSVVGKMLGRIIIDRIRNGVDCRLRKEQAGYRKGRGTTEQVFILRNIIEQVNEWQATLYLNFIDFEKAFDSIHRGSMWTIMMKYGIPEKIVRMVEIFYQDFQCAVVDQGETCEWFDIKTGVKQGCNMSGFLFLLVMDWIMKRTVGNGENGIRWNFMSKLDDLDFADDVALLSSTKQQIQDKTTRMVDEARRVGLRINIDKTKLMKINVRNQEKITIGGRDIEEVDEFTYLGAIVCKEGGGMKDLRNRLSKARGAFVRLKRIWSSNNIYRRTKLRLYRTLVVPVLLYGCETWKLNKGDDKTIDVFNNRCLRRILKIKWQDHVSTVELLKRADLKPLSEEVKWRRWKMIGHILRQDPKNDCNIALTWAPEGKRRRGRPKTTWRRTVEKERREAGWDSWNQVRVIAADKKGWRCSVKALCATRHEEDR